MFKLTKYGTDVIIKFVILSFILIGIHFFLENLWLKLLFFLLGFLLLLFTLYFFRDPERKLPKDFVNGKIISPGDGKIVLIEDVVNKNENLFAVGEPLKMISIFLSPLNVHVNRIPLTGKVSYLKYIKGDYVVAFDHKSSERNERTEIGITSSDNKKILFKQIAGFVARRIVYVIKENDEVTAGERFGMIKFGSRVDIFIRPDAKINVKMNEMVTGGETIIAEI
ncbi:hypothetical protein BH10BAC5_BH10BAC5_27390 [soil metagenome]